MKILLLDRVHELFHQQFLKWNWVVVEGFNWTRSEFVDQIHLFDGYYFRNFVSCVCYYSMDKAFKIRSTSRCREGGPEIRRFGLRQSALGRLSCSAPKSPDFGPADL